MQVAIAGKGATAVILTISTHHSFAKESTFKAADAASFLIIATHARQF